MVFYPIIGVCVRGRIPERAGEIRLFCVISGMTAESTGAQMSPMDVYHVRKNHRKYPYIIMIIEEMIETNTPFIFGKAKKREYTI